MQATDLRDYQKAAIDSVISYFRSGEKGNPIIVAPTGSGKSHIISGLYESIITTWAGVKIRIAIISHRKEILEQNFDKLLPGLKVSFYSASIGKKETHGDIIIGQIQSCYKAAHKLGHLNIIIVDECHLVPNESLGMYRKFFAACREINPKIRIVGLTATPYRLDSGSIVEGEDRIFTDIVYDIDLVELIEKGYLSPLRSIYAKQQADLTGLRSARGEFLKGEMQKRFIDPVQFQRSLMELVARGKDRKSWLVFCAGVEHAQLVAEALKHQYGVNAAFVSGQTNKQERKILLEKFKRGEIQALCNCDVLCLDEKTEILTLNGWKGIDSISPKDEVANWKESISAHGNEIFFKRPKAIVKRFRMKPEKMVSMQSSYHSFRVTSNHRMLFRPNEHRWFKLTGAENLVGKRGQIPISSFAEPVLFETNKKNKKSPQEEGARIRANSYALRKKGMSPEEAKREAIRRIKLREDFKFKNPEELTLDECRFIGFWIGDGTSSTSSSGRCSRYSCSQSFAYPKIIDWFSRVLKKTKIHHTIKIYKKAKKANFDSLRWDFSRGTGFGEQRISGGIFPLEPYLKKSGTNLFFGFNVEQFDALLEGFWFADGNHSQLAERPEYFWIHNTNHELLSILQGVASCRGLRAKITKGFRAKAFHKQIYKLHISKRRIKNLTKNCPVTLEEDFKSERVWCVTSHTGNIVTRHNGSVTIMGNTTGFDAPNIDMLVLLRATKSTALYVQMVGRGARKCEGKENCLVLDFGGNIERHGPINLIKLKDGKTKGSKEISKAPHKKCPECDTANPISALRCEFCDFEFPVIPRGMPKDDKPAELDIIAKAKASKVFSIFSMKLSRHKKTGKPDSIMIEYWYGDEGSHVRSSAREWLCFDHGGFPAQKARMWWRTHARAGSVPPASTNEALARQGELLTPRSILIKRNGKYTEVVWTSRDGTEAPGGSETNVSEVPGNLDGFHLPQDLTHLG